MERIISYILLALLIVGCAKEEDFVPPMPYAKHQLVIENATHSDIYVWCDQINGVAQVELKKGEKTDVLTTSKDVIELKYFGVGTYYKQKKIRFEMKEGEINVIRLE